MEKHTPGPWFVNHENICAPDGDCDPWFVAKIDQDCGPSREECPEANARLIASAPELLAACRYIVETHDCKKAREMATAAIVKALG